MQNPLQGLINNMLAQGVNNMLGVQQQPYQQNAGDVQSQFDNFKRSFQGDPKAIVQQLRSSGQMSNQQFEMLSVLANALSGKLH